MESLTCSIKIDIIQHENILFSASVREILMSLSKKDERRMPKPRIRLERQTYTIDKSAKILGICRAVAYRKGVLPSPRGGSGPRCDISAARTTGVVEKKTCPTSSAARYRKLHCPKQRGRNCADWGKTPRPGKRDRTNIFPLSGRDCCWTTTGMCSHAKMCCGRWAAQLASILLILMARSKEAQPSLPKAAGSLCA